MIEKTWQAAGGQAYRLIELFLYLEGGPLDDENRLTKATGCPPHFEPH